MINYHPNQELLTLHAQGELPLSLSIAISAHCELCSHCADKIEKLTLSASKASFNAESLSETIAPQMSDVEMDAELEAMLSSMMQMDDSIDDSTTQAKVAVNVRGQQYNLPSAFRQQVINNWQGIGKVSRSRLDTGEPQARASLLHIDKNGEIPQHTHKGEELTLLLAGEFSDEYNTYTAGDFMLLNNEHEHSPKTVDGCLCYTVVDAPLYFTKGISKLLNPIGELIY
ncbi:ChrR family anti-sigma-E factor [Shewanella donghaensis]|uniref:ChrR family anti-sigma-E factor n=1 Tax=Shewanella donghaensis TaxID=238836 RepID=UPI0011822245|nr:ChrR family anti-sigma-E factor [Shewanella donghaensis]